MKKLLLLAMSLCMALFVSCSKDKSSDSTNNGGSGLGPFSVSFDIINITATSANYYISVSLSDNDELEEIGVCWSTEDDNPSISTGSFMTAEDVNSHTFTIENLTPNTLYYISGFFKCDSKYYYYPTKFTTLEE